MDYCSRFYNYRLLQISLVRRVRQLLRARLPVSEGDTGEKMFQELMIGGWGLIGVICSLLCTQKNKKILNSDQQIQGCETF